MYVTAIPNRKSRATILLRESYREGKKVKSRTLANLSKWDEFKIEALKKVLSGGVEEIAEVPEIGKSFGLLYAMKEIAGEIGITKALGKSREGLLALFLIIARIGNQGSRLSARRWSRDQAIEEVLGIEEIKENELYKALDWVEENQEEIEAELYKRYKKEKGKPPVMVLYDVTSSYFEGEKNELAEFGYNRDKKKGKKQIVIGLLTDEEGEPLAVRVFKGNRNDVSTVDEQIEVVKNRFGIEEVVFVGDKGMIKSRGKEELNKVGLRYITTLSKKEIESLVKKNNIQMEMFREEIREVRLEGKRYILRCNIRIRERLRKEREKRVEKIKKMVEARNNYVRDHKRAKVESGEKAIRGKLKAYRISGYIRLEVEGREIKVEIEEDKHEELYKLDGCYAIETDVREEVMSGDSIDRNYHRLSKVERDFKNMKTEMLEVRPIYLRKGNRTRGHVLITSLALRVTRRLESKLKERFGVDEKGHYRVTVEESIKELSKISFLSYSIKDKKKNRLAKLSVLQEEILEGIRNDLAGKLSKCSQKNF